MEMVASEIDHSKADHAEGWHMSLLKRMANPEAVISSGCYNALDQLRAFRHRHRNSYGLTLDRTIVLERATQTKQAFDIFRSEMAAFAVRMQKPDADEKDRR